MIAVAGDGRVAGKGPAVLPAALLLDFGGVLADAPAAQRSASPELVLRIYNLINGVLSPGQIQQAFASGGQAYARWRDEDAPDELLQAEVWERFVIRDWPPAAQVPVRGAIARLSYDWAFRPGWALRPGIREALDAYTAAGVPLAVVSNTLSGAAHRDFLAAAGVGDLFAVQVYSDEAGVRKPNPQMIWNATDVLGVDPRACWFVGDSRRRDVACARRADVARAILMPSGRQDPPGSPEPDVVVEDGHELAELIRW
ncbi:haloacid dehalogenase [Actinoplanes sp. SE50]|uniref:HAD family hydrolase n=1 Tax=unclassified Actinoplanes TaxID=2626549 RepID=UPI00023ED6D5|nr:MULTISPECIES: HAD family hydrolase [unclassified Actinoplanes]AEV87919.1 Haloacid dehalogenase-like hydrolase domain-containing protein 3 [Actinoplanes sp. SE50/110]ATO86323.1 haloacid dehalogenase [Actinoplanes sp. SE50]SLM03738.1 haloacid dehalogenase [Actinoplanes sp. SE50/110]